MDALPRKPLGRSDVFRRYLRAAGIEKHARWHDLRHGCASSLIGGWWGRRWPLQEVKVMLGHSSVTVTERYAHLADSVLRDAARETTTVDVPVETLPVVAAHEAGPTIRDAAMRVAFDFARRLVGRVTEGGNAS